MTWLYLLVFGSLVAGIILALAWWLIWGRRAGLPFGPASGFTITAGLLALVGDIVRRLLDASILLPFDVPRFLSDWYWDYRFTVPLLVGILSVVFLAFPVHARGGRGTAELTRRSPISFARARWFLAPGVLLALILLITVVAGAASEPDSVTGRYTMYSVDLGGERGMGTGIYGWFFSIPAMILTGILIVISIVGLSLIARPALAEDQERDIRVRTIRTRNIVVAGTGALLLHLGLIFSSLAGTASIRAWFTTSEGPVAFWTTFSALQPVFTAASMLCAALGIALWATIALSAIPSRRRVPVMVGS
ncbi:hypothetical protein [Cryobacterium psychrophilum]|uniref:Uncharacterized protein n=1 Tax=Cryobacterium psychrophilum TaxID=41988 RepID=A0A4Y8KIT3_9MICO|nr:hypothetical protein [Cryobacterium psychrophilum]TDW29207.1 hypothetical protein EDD25_0895 [Cryobacterium psychrophilum]TFD74655.1 hypothetical protein E3T53_16955 [Cryobacterium psychrophilum]